MLLHSGRTWIDGVNSDSRAFELAAKFVREKDVGELRVLVRLKAVVCAIVEEQKIVHVHWLNNCKNVYILE